MPDIIGKRFVESAIKRILFVEPQSGYSTGFNDTVRVETEVVSARPSSSRTDAGIVVFAHRAQNQHNDVVCTCRRTGLMHRRPSS